MCIRDRIRIAAAHPDSDAIFGAYSAALSFSGKTAEAEKIAKERLARLPKDRPALQALAQNAAYAGDYTTAERYAQQIIDELTPTLEDYNNAAWYALFTRKDLDHALEQARHAAGNDRRSDSAALHTLAAVYAEMGKNLEAREALMQSIRKRGSDKPESSDWYVLGRIAENYGVKDAALAAYHRVDNKDFTGASTFELAKRRLATLELVK